MNVYPEFPEHRLKDPKRQAELLVYRELQKSDAPGVAIYEARPDYQCKELDYFVPLTGVGRYGIQVKGGDYRTEKGAWYLATPGGEERKDSPLKQAWDSTMGMHDFLQEHITGNRNPFIVPVIVFPDMKPDKDIEACAMQAGVRILFGADNLVERLVELAGACNFFYPPTAAEVAEEVELLMPGLGNPVPEETEVPATPPDLQPRHFIIQHAGTVNVELLMPGPGNPVPEETEVPATPLDLQPLHFIIQHADSVNVYITLGGPEPPQQDSPSVE